MTQPIIILFLIALLAFAISAICGGGAGLILMPILGMVLPVSQVPAALSIGTSFSSVSRLVVFIKTVRWDIVRWFVPAATPAVFIGAFLLKFINPLYLEILMGAFLIGNLRSLFNPPSENETTSNSKLSLSIIGFLAGFLSGLTGAVGLVFNRFYLRYGLSKEEIIATRAANEITLHIIKLILYCLFGLLTLKVLLVGGTIAAAAILSSWIMKWGLQKISENIFKKIGYGAMVLSGIMMLTQSGQTLFSQNYASLKFTPVNNGLESKLNWQQAHLALEFEYDEGFEYEQQIPFSELSGLHQQHVTDNDPKSSKIIIEEVFGFGRHSYEAYYYDNQNVLIKKIDF